MSVRVVQDDNTNKSAVLASVDEEAAPEVSASAPSPAVPEPAAAKQPEHDPDADQARVALQIGSTCVSTGTNKGKEKYKPKVPPEELVKLFSSKALKVIVVEAIATLPQRVRSEYSAQVREIIAQSRLPGQTWTDILMNVSSLFPFEEDSIYNMDSVITILGIAESMQLHKS